MRLRSKVMTLMHELIEITEWGTLPVAYSTHLHRGGLHNEAAC